MYVLVLSIILATESRIETYDFSSLEKCREAQPLVVKSVKELYVEADVLSTCLPKATEKDLK